MWRKRRQGTDNLAEPRLIEDRLLQQNAIDLRRLQDELTPDEERVLDYFWNGKEQKQRPRIYQSVIYFFETDSWDETLYDTIRSRVNAVTFDLQNKSYVAQKSDSYGTYFVLEPKGVAHLKDEHPTVLVYWKRLLELSPPTLSLLVAIIGFVASLFGIIQFIAWVKQMGPATH